MCLAIQVAWISWFVLSVCAFLVPENSKKKKEGYKCKWKDMVPSWAEKINMKELEKNTLHSSTPPLRH